MAKISFKLVSPEKDLFSADADMVIIPAESGDMGVMAGHSPVIGTVRPGCVVVRSGSEETRLFIEGGFLEVTDSTATVLAERGELVSDITLSDAQTQLQNAATDREIATATARLEAVQSPCYK